MNEKFNFDKILKGKDTIEVKYFNKIVRLIILNGHSNIINKIKIPFS
jgi:hypothetical protein